ncbi:class GN sortase [Gilvimarinus algae]|uniref:Class GN sortase n=1 Tax=Gilvimarinus algae TaxID=3058037 RepID=A0ABT8TGX1_9GAMM|nr:class GN sortase [Gilvimarinus sp. SDUM040014]MDO3383342.1 class GN sortase [Gilvimarinus sp. SDUM040014]
MSARNSRPLPAGHKGRLWISALLLLVLLWQWGNAFGIELKAQLAQMLIERAWQQKLDAPGLKAAPWPWADTQPVGRLQWLDERGRVQKDLYVLAGAHGEALAFGPGLMADAVGTDQRARVIGGHRDTHFRFLQKLSSGDRLRWQGADGHWRTYVISQRSIADVRTEELWIEPAADALWLVTCYPFNELRAGGPLRYVVRADSLEAVTQQYADAGVRL